MKVKTRLTILIILTSFIIYSQNKRCDCSEALNAALKDKFTDSQLLDLRIELYEYYKFLKKDSQNSSSSYKLSSAAKAFTGYGIFQGTVENNNENNNAKTQNIEKIIEKDQSISEDVFKQMVTDVFSDNQLEAYKSCLKQCEDQSNSGVFYEISGDIEYVFALNLRFTNRIFANHSNVTLSSNATLINCEPIGGLLLKKDLTIGNNQSITQYLKIIDRDKPAQIGLNFNEISFGAINLGDEYMGTGKSLPIGTIISSNFKYDTFLEANQYKKTDNMSKATWIPCDGRNVSASKYGKFSGVVPDLRGVFLRNVNDYNVPFDGVGKVKEDQANPDNTVAGVLQHDSYQSHFHNSQIAENRTGFPKESEDSSPGLAPHQSYWRGNKNLDSPVSIAATSPSGGNETRPKNISVYYYIKIN